MSDLSNIINRIFGVLHESKDVISSGFSTVVSSVNLLLVYSVIALLSLNIILLLYILFFQKNTGGKTEIRK